MEGRARALSSAPLRRSQQRCRADVDGNAPTASGGASEPESGEERGRERGGRAGVRARSDVQRASAGISFTVSLCGSAAAGARAVEAHREGCSLSGAAPLADQVERSPVLSELLLLRPLLPANAKLPRGRHVACERDRARRHARAPVGGVRMLPAPCAGIGRAQVVLGRISSFLHAVALIRLLHPPLVLPPLHLAPRSRPPPLQRRPTPIVHSRSLFFLRTAAALRPLFIPFPPPSVNFLAARAQRHFSILSVSRVEPLMYGCC